LGLEEDIQQKRPFKSEKERVLVNVMYTNNWIVDHLRQRLKSYGLTRSQYNILRILAGANAPMTTSDIRSRMLEKMSDISRLIDRLRVKGWVSKEVRPADKRLVDIVITPAGVKLLADVATHNEQMFSFANELKDDEAKLLNQLLDKLRG